MTTEITWQEIVAITTLLGVIIGFYTSVKVQLKVLGIEVDALKKGQERTDAKFDAIMQKLELISVGLSNKVDKD